MLERREECEVDHSVIPSRLCLIRQAGQPYMPVRQIGTDIEDMEICLT